ncbi:MAG TPA: hypothetical protein VMW52_10880 [Phycisphaerae bacterium]|nr:hypothetical protein [Phycisphaerae bacterium]
MGEPWLNLVVEAAGEGGVAEPDAVERLHARLRVRADYLEIRNDFLRGHSERGREALKSRLVRLIRAMTAIRG